MPETKLRKNGEYEEEKTGEEVEGVVCERPAYDHLIIADRNVRLWLSKAEAKKFDEESGKCTGMPYRITGTVPAGNGESEVDLLFQSQSEAFKEMKIYKHTADTRDSNAHFTQLKKATDKIIAEALNLQGPLPFDDEIVESGIHLGAEE